MLAHQPVTILIQILYELLPDVHLFSLYHFFNFELLYPQFLVFVILCPFLLNFKLLVFKVYLLLLLKLEIAKGHLLILFLVLVQDVLVFEGAEAAMLELVGLHWTSDLFHGRVR
jgi:hypothetical protein